MLGKVVVEGDVGGMVVLASVSFFVAVSVVESAVVEAVDVRGVGLVLEPSSLSKVVMVDVVGGAVDVKVVMVVASGSLSLVVSVVVGEEEVVVVELIVVLMLSGVVVPAPS